MLGDLRTFGRQAVAFMFGDLGEFIGEHFQSDTLLNDLT